MTTFHVWDKAGKAVATTPITLNPDGTYMLPDLLWALPIGHYTGQVDGGVVQAIEVRPPVGTRPLHTQPSRPAH